MTALRRDARLRGQPLIVLGAILGGWLALRLVFWQSPFDSPALAPVLVHAPSPEAAAHFPALDAAPRSAKASAPRSRLPAVPGPDDAPNAQPVPAPLPLSPLPLTPEPAHPLATRIIGQQLLLAAAFSNLVLPPEIAAYLTGSRAGPAIVVASKNRPPETEAAPPSNAAGRSCWSGDAWLLWRRDAGGPLAAAEPSYGRSQAGAVLRYRLEPASKYRPTAYARVTRALAGAREAEVAAGLAARPLPRLPVSVAAELRVANQSGEREIRPAAFAVTELPPAKLPLGLRAEGYAQAGYVWGRYATAFIDGQARLDAPLVRLENDAQVRAGAGTWGGMQKRAGRLDVGPTATVSFRLGEARSRIAVDYRVRVAGEAKPSSGPSLTFSAGF